LQRLGKGLHEAVRPAWIGPEKQAG
jgi:hypothetical protein